jgi:hypothetical protein
VVAAILGGLASPAAAQNYVVDIEVDGTRVQRSFPSLNDALNLLRTQGLAAIVPNYSSASSVVGNVNVLGLPVVISQPAGAAAATVTVPSTGETRTVEGASRAEVQSNLRQLFEGTGNTQAEAASNQAFATSLRQEVVRGSALDPVAGHPLSLMGQMAAGDFRAATNPIGALPTGTLDRPAGWRFAAGPGFASTASGLDNRFYALSLGASYTFAPNGAELFADAPVAVADQGGAQYYQGSFGLGLRYPVLSRPGLQWALVPQIRAGAAGSDTLGTGGYVLSGSLTSDLRLDLGRGWSMQLGNSLAYNETRPLEFDGFKIDYELQNQVWRNGIAVGRRLGEVAGRAVHGALSFTDSRVTGDRVFVPSWQEYGVSLVVPGRVPVSFTASYLDGRQGFQGVRFGLTAAF